MPERPLVAKPMTLEIDPVVAAEEGDSTTTLIKSRLGVAKFELKPPGAFVRTFRQIYPSPDAETWFTSYPKARINFVAFVIRHEISNGEIVNERQVVACK